MRSRLTLLALAAIPLCPSLASAQVFTQDDGDTENALNIGSTAEIGMVHRYVADLAGENVTELRVAIGTALATPGGLDGLTLKLAIWDDPNGDGDLADAVLLYSSAGQVVSQSHSDVKVTYPVTPTVTVSGSFFVGAIVVGAPASDFPIGLDISGKDVGELAYVIGDAASVDLDNLFNNTVTPSLQSNAVFLLDAATDSGGPVGTNYCGPAVPNSTGNSASIAGQGLTNAAANNLTLTATDLPINQFGIFVNSLTQGFIANPGGSQGNLCVIGAIGRYNGPGQILSSGASGAFSLDLDLTQTPTPSGFVAITAGQTWNFQAWFRDFIPGQGLTSNFTDGLEVTFN